MASISRYQDNPQGLFGLQRLNRLLDEAFTSFPFGEPSTAITSAWFAPTDVSEDNESLQISMELPGVRPEDVKLSLENNLLTIRGEKRQHAEEQAERIHRYERSYGTFERTFAQWMPRRSRRSTSMGFSPSRSRRASGPGLGRSRSARFPAINPLR